MSRTRMCRTRTCRTRTCRTRTCRTRTCRARPRRRGGSRPTTWPAASDKIQPMARRDLSLETLGLAPDAEGVLASQHLRRAIDAGALAGASGDSVQPASVDLHLGEVAYRIRCSFLPGASDVDAKLKDLVIDELDLEQGAVLETNRPYLIPLVESLDLPEWLSAKANPKSSTGRLDVFTRVITDGSFRFDAIDAGYTGGLFLEVVPLSFTVRVRHGLTLNQLRLRTADTRPLTDVEVRELHERDPLLARRDVPVPSDRLAASDGLFLGLDLRGGRDRRVGYRSRDHTTVIDMGLVGHYDATRYWESVIAEPEDRVVLDPERFYLLLSDEAVRIPPRVRGRDDCVRPDERGAAHALRGILRPGVRPRSRRRLHRHRAPRSRCARTTFRS